jgi:hypothetical protein
MSGIRAFVRNADGTETDITEGVQALYDLVIDSMDWGSGRLTAEDARPVALLARTLGFERVAEAERYLRDQEHSDQQQQFIRDRKAAIETTGTGWVRTVQWHQPGTAQPLPHDHVFSTAGRCMWPGCRELGELDPPEGAPAGGVPMSPAEFEAFTRKHGVRWEQL